MWWRTGGPARKAADVDALSAYVLISMNAEAYSGGSRIFERGGGRYRAP